MEKFSHVNVFFVSEETNEFRFPLKFFHMDASIHRRLGQEAANVNEQDITEIYRYFGSVEVTLITLFQAITSGVDWKDPYDAWLTKGFLPLFQEVRCLIF